ncbi:MAG TPA: phosphohistidine phosphatase SixA [Burkholderiaceae bacterium]|nr:phosphohistidine phosphatase SixA [Burkholderiaceae bacterium]
MELILWRHAEAELAEPDHGRKLTARGEKQARRMAEWLHARLPDSARILASPATRAQQTARALAELAQRKLVTVDALAPDADSGAVLVAAGWPVAKVPVVVVGHQPTLGLVASRLLAGEEQPWSVKKGGVWWLSARDRDGARQVVLRAVCNPDFA